MGTGIPERYLVKPLIILMFASIYCDGFPD